MDESVPGVGARLDGLRRRVGRGRGFSVRVANFGAHFKRKMNLWSRYLETQIAQPKPCSGD
ncbi:Hypothetical predicted protein [Marmota monax]|uniref:Uncharacterized protein n=1 Tax=Marmota monax TaxID=9995 RepID=A0A5E4AMY8_MARMO|nr:hypothetical protein GHT09_016840 [Marmota monax]VTJ58767.1 Hypothetical predicted protein [Marmota monax]